MSMDHADEPGYEKRPRSGLIPWTRAENGEPCFMMMVSSNPKFGGPRPMISKGKIELGEDELQCAIREAEEELGLRTDNLIGSPELLASERVELRSGAYHLTVYSVQIRDRWNFDKWCDETEYTLWMTLDEFKEQGRRDHLKYVEALRRRIVEMKHADLST